jgi:hypothetical protein
VTAAEHAFATAGSWRALAEAAQDALALAGGAVDSLHSNNSGEAVEALVARWHTVARPPHGALPELVDLCGRLAQVCEHDGRRGELA